jgi:SsrA-binding protein
MGLARGKKAHDKRAALMEKQANREVDRELARRTSGKSSSSKRSEFDD